MILSSIVSQLTKFSSFCSLENFIMSKNPKSIHDVELLTREYFLKEKYKCW